MTRIKWISLAAILLPLLISSCSTIAPPAPSVQIPVKDRETSLGRVENWQLNGKIAINTAHDSGSATIDWIQIRNRYTISLFGPLGSNSLKLAGSPGHVTVQTSDGKSASASSPEQLLAKVWGWRLPVSSMHYWIRGLPVPGIPAQSHFDSYGRLTQLNQQGYDVQYLAYTSSKGVDLPSKVFITSPALKVKVIVYGWKI